MIGLSVALSLARKGVAVTVLEREPSTGQGTSAAAAGPVQLAGLGSGAAGLLDGARREHRAGHARAGRRRLPATASLGTIYTFSRPRP